MTAKSGSATASNATLAVLLASFIATTYGFGIYLFSQLVTDMRLDLGFDYRLAGIFTASGQGSFLVFALISAWLSSRLGSAQVVIGSVSICGASLLLLAATENVVLVGVLLVVMSGTAASVWVPMVDIVSRKIDYRHRGKVLGLASSGTSYGVFVNSLLVSIFVASGNWRGAWITVGTITVIVTAFAVAVFLRFGLFRRDDRAIESLASATRPQAAATKSLAGWVWIVWLLTFLNGLSTLPFQNYLSPYIREEIGLSVDFAATVWATIGLIGMFAGLLVGWLSDRTGVRTALLASYTCLLAAALILIVAPFSYLPLVAGLLFALAFYPIFGLVPAYVAKASQDGRSATMVFGIANVTLGAGGIVGNYAGGLGRSITGSFIWVYVAVAATALLLLALTTFLPRERS